MQSAFFTLYNGNRTAQSQWCRSGGAGCPEFSVCTGYCPYESELIETLYAPVDGKVFFIHNEPLTYANTAVIKLVQ